MISWGFIGGLMGFNHEIGWESYGITINNGDTKESTDENGQSSLIVLK